MKCYVIFAAVLFTLDLICCAQVTWEVLNDVKSEEDDDRMTQQELLTRENLLPVLKPKPKPKALLIKEQMDKKAAKEKAVAAESNVPRKAVPAPVLLKGPKPPGKDRGGGGGRGRGGDGAGWNDFKDDDLLPLSGPHANQRHLLQVLQGPQLPADVERQRLREKSLLDNLSEPCQDVVDGDCLFDIDTYVSEKELTERGNPQAPRGPTEENSEEPLIRALGSHSHRRIKRQDNKDDSDDKGNSKDDSDDKGSNKDESSDKSNSKDESSNYTDEGSGASSSDELFNSEEVYEEAGVYNLNLPVTITVSDNVTLDKDLIAAISKSLNEKLSQLLSDFPGFAGINVKLIGAENGTLKFDVEVQINAQDAAGVAGGSGETNLEDYLFNALADSLIPSINNLDIEGFTISEDDKLDAAFVDSLMTVLGDYCNSEAPCADAGPEFNAEACVNLGFMSGSCPHKCKGYPCENGGICMVDSSYEPYCNCGREFTGEFCEKTKTKKDEGLSTTETVGVVVAGVMLGSGVTGLMIYLACLKRSSGDVNYTYYGDDEAEDEAVSDPTSYNYVFERPIILGFHAFHLENDNTGGNGTGNSTENECINKEPTEAEEETTTTKKKKK